MACDTPACFLCEVLAEAPSPRTAWCAAFALGLEMGSHGGAIASLCKECQGALRRAVADICTDTDINTTCVLGEAAQTTNVRGVA